MAGEPRMISRFQYGDRGHSMEMRVSGLFDLRVRRYYAPVTCGGRRPWRGRGRRELAETSRRALGRTKLLIGLSALPAARFLSCVQARTLQAR